MNDWCVKIIRAVMLFEIQILLLPIKLDMLLYNKAFKITKTHKFIRWFENV